MEVQVSIPKTSTVNSAYIAYHVLVKLPLRKYELMKRYSDFTKLVTNMEQELHSQKFPLAVPPKTNGLNILGGWMGSKNKDLEDYELIEYRRTQFERIIQKIITTGNDIDGKWRSTSAFEEFLELPPGLFNEKEKTQSNNRNSKQYGSNDTNDTKSAIYGTWSLASQKSNDPIIDTKVWLDTVRTCKKLLQLARSDCYSNQQQTRKNLLIAKSNFEPLSQGLRYHEVNNNRSAKSGSTEKIQNLLGEGEIRRRKDLLNSITQEHSKIESLLSSINEDKFSTKSSGSDGSQIPGSFRSSSPNSNNLFGKISGRRVLGQPLQETKVTRGLNDNELLQQQKLQMKNQDSELEYLHEVIKRQKAMGLTINEELDYQNELLDELNHEVDNTSTKLRYANKKTKKINQ